MGNIYIKDIDVLQSILGVPFDPHLIEMVRLIDFLYPGVTTITSGYRPDDPGVHGTYPCRGLDLRSWNYKKPYHICRTINETWEYDPERPEMVCAIYHNVGRGQHIHLQAHPRTRRRDLSAGEIEHG